MAKHKKITKAVQLESRTQQYQPQGESPAFADSPINHLANFTAAIDENDATEANRIESILYLEKFYNTILIDRNSERGLKLTEAGTNLYIRFAVITDPQHATRPY
jgi:hypothetical protein